jgi:hypothetical protein
VCRSWRLDAPDATVVDRAVLVANELVTNAVIHAHSDLWLKLELRGDRLFISVRDRGSRRLRPVTPDLEAEGGRGLWLVEQLARAWGVRPASGGGKTVWCASPSDPRASSRKVPPAAGPWTLTGRRRREEGGVERNGALDVRRTE